MKRIVYPLLISENGDTYHFSLSGHLREDSEGFPESLKKKIVNKGRTRGRKGEVHFALIFFRALWAAFWT
jgi:hypothetical protein